MRFRQSCWVGRARRPHASSLTASPVPQDVRENVFGLDQGLPATARGWDRLGQALLVLPRHPSQPNAPPCTHIAAAYSTTRCLQLLVRPARAARRPCKGLLGRSVDGLARRRPGVAGVQSGPLDPKHTISGCADCRPHTHPVAPAGAARPFSKDGPGPPSRASLLSIAPIRVCKQPILSKHASGLRECCLAAGCELQGRQKLEEIERNAPSWQVYCCS